MRTKASMVAKAPGDRGSFDKSKSFCAQKLRTNTLQRIAHYKALSTATSGLDDPASHGTAPYLQEPLCMLVLSN